MSTLLPLVLGSSLLVLAAGPAASAQSGDAAAPSGDAVAPPGDAAVPPGDAAAPPGDAAAPPPEVPAPNLPREPGRAPSSEGGSEAAPEQPRVPEQPRGGEPAPAPAPAPEGAREEPDYELRGRGDLPYAPTAARVSAVRRGNAVLVRPFREPVFSAAAAARLGVLLAGGTDVIQPIGYGFGAQLRAHFAPVFKSRFGLELHAGHTRYSERQEFESAGFEGATVIRASLLTATDISLGPSFEIPLGPVFVQFGASAGVALSTLLRPRSGESAEDELVSVANVLLRGGSSLGVPIFNGHGLNLGVAIDQVFSAREVAIDLAFPEGEQTRPFGTSLEVFAGYQIWF